MVIQKWFIIMFLTPTVDYHVSLQMCSPWVTYSSTSGPGCTDS